MAQRLWNWVKNHPCISAAAAAGSAYAVYTYLNTQNQKKAAIEAERIRRNREESERRERARREQQAANAAAGTLPGTLKVEESPGQKSRNAAVEKVAEKIVGEVTQAPDFSMEAYWEGEYSTVSLSDFKGKWVVIMFTTPDHPLTAADQLISLNDNLPRFKQFSTEVIVVSPDSKTQLQSVVEQPRSEGGLGGADFIIISDMNSTLKGKYGVGQQTQGLQENMSCVVIVDPQGHIAERQKFPSSATHLAHDVIASIGRLQQTK